MTQILESGDIFELGPTAWGDWAQGYLRLRPSNAAADATTGYSIVFAIADIGSLHDGYGGNYASANLDTSVTLPVRGPASISTGTANGGPTAQMYRVPYNGDVKAQIVFHIAALNGLVNPNGYFKHAWVGARIRGTALAGSPPTQYHSSTGAIARSYWFALNSAGSANTAKWQLLRKDTAGDVWTVLAESAAPFSLGTLQISSPRMMRLEVSDEAGDVRLKCYTAATLGSGQIPPGNPAEVEIFNFLDNSASKITAEGRVGFVSALEQTVSSVQHVQLIDSFRVEFNGNLQRLDEFERVRPSMHSSVTTFYGPNGRDLCADWSGGIGTAIGRKLRISPSPTWTDQLMNAGTEPLGSVADPVPGGYLFSVRPATQAKAQNRSADFVFEASGAAPTARAFGVFVRASGGADAVIPTSGYFVEIFQSSPPAATLIVYRFGPGATRTEIARVSGSITINLDTQYTLGLECYTVASANGVPDAMVALIVSLDGVEQTLVSSIAGVLIISGDAYDTTSERVISGFAEGIRLYKPDGARRTYFDTWVEGPLAIPALPIPASIVMQSETWDHTGQTLTLPLSWPVVEQRPRVVDRARMEDGHKYKRARYGRLRRVFRVQARHINDTDRDTLRAFWDAHNGCEKAFSWTPPLEAASIDVHFATDKLAHILAAVGPGGGINSFPFELEELFDH